MPGMKCSIVCVKTPNIVLFDANENINFCKLYISLNCQTSKQDRRVRRAGRRDQGQGQGGRARVCKGVTITSLVIVLVTMFVTILVTTTIVTMPDTILTQPWSPSPSPSTSPTSSSRSRHVKNLSSGSGEQGRRC